MNKQIAVLGLGVFGETVARTLEEYGCEVIAIEKNMEIVESISDDITLAVSADFTDIEQLKELDLQDVDSAVIASGTRLEDAVLAVLNLQELGIEKIIAKAANARYGRVLKKVGADIIVEPEKEVGKEIAKSLMADNVVDLSNLDDQHSVVEIKVNEKWIGKNLLEIRLREDYGLTAIAIRSKEGLILNIDPERVFEAEDTLLFLADTHDRSHITQISDLEVV